jgi:GAF domain-containing protein
LRPNLGLAGFLRTGARSWYASLDMGADALELKRLEALAQAFRLLSPLTTREEVYARTVQALKENTRAVSVLLWLYRPEEDQLELVAAAGLSPSKLGVRFSRGQGVSWEVLEKGEPLFLPDVSQDPRVVFLSGKRQAGVYLGVPLRSPEGQVLGVLSLDTAGGVGEILPEERFLVQALAEAARMVLSRIEALERARLEAERYKAFLDLTLALEASREPLAMAQAGRRPSWKSSICSLHGDALGQVPRLVHVPA